MQFAGEARVGPYRIVAKIAEGGMGSVFEALHVGLDKRVALKVLRPEIAGDTEVVSRFLAEGRAASRLRHPNVIDVTDVGVHDGMPFLVMELLDGESLATRIERAGPFSVVDAASVMLPLLDALAAAHDAGIVHRDLKPQNIFLATTRSRIVPKILDFGISRVGREDQSRLTQGGALLGTPRYMAPEQIRDARTVDARSDVFSLGLVLYEMLTGAPAICGESLVEVVHAITTGEITPPSRRRPELGGGVEALLLRMLAVRPVDRFPSMRAVGSALVPFASADVQSAWRPSFDAAAIDPLGRTGFVSPSDPTPVIQTARGFACPPFEVSGVPAPTGWIGAAAAHAVARRARWLFGGRIESTDPPVVLADLPSEPSATYGVSPFDDPANLAKASAVAAKAPLALRGTVERRRSRLSLRVELPMGARPPVVATADGTTLAEAARGVVLALGAQLGWQAIEDEARETYGVTDGPSGVFVEDLLAEMDGLEPADVPEAHRAGLGAIGAALEIGRKRAPATYDPSTPATRAWTSYALALLGMPLAADVEATLRADIEAAQSLEAQSVFRGLAALRVLTVDPERAWSFGLRATQLQPRATFAWRALALAAPAPRWSSSFTFRVMTWCPDSRCIHPSDPEAEREWGSTLAWRRAILLADAWSAAFFPMLLVAKGELVHAEEFTAELDERQGMEDYASHARAQVEMRQGRFTPALDRLRRIAFRTDLPLGRIVDSPAIFFALELGTLWGSAGEVADEVLTRRLLGPMAPAAGASKGLEMLLLHVVLHASPDVARAAVAKLRQLASERAFRWQVDTFDPCLRSVEHWVHGRTGQMASSVRALVDVPEYGPTLAMILDLAGRADLGLRADKTLMQTDHWLAGFSIAHLRTARRLATMGRPDEARALARSLVDAWSVAEDDLPVLGELRVLAGN